MTIAYGPIFQLCWVVREMAAAQREFGDRYGITEWLTMREVRFGPQTCEYRGAPADYTITVALGYAGGQQLELIEPRSGVSPYADHLAAHGPGLHHIAWVPEDYEAALAAATAAGAQIIARGVFGEVGLEFSYLDGGPLGSYVELMRLSPDMKAMFDYLIPEGHTNPWA